jgi:hypothetical protein
LKKTKLVKQLDKYEKFSQFLNKAQLLFNGSSLDYQDIHQMIKRHESLTFMLDDTRDRLDKLNDTVSKFKIEFLNVIQCHSDRAIEYHERRQHLKSDLNERETKNVILYENFNSRIDLVNGKTIEFDLISKSIGNLFELLNKFTCLKKTPFEMLNQTSDVKFQLKFIGRKLNDLKEISLM